MRRMAALAADMLRMRMSKDEHVTLGLSFRLLPWKVGSSLLGPIMCKGICQLPCNPTEHASDYWLRNVTSVCDTICSPTVPLSFDIAQF